MLGGFAVAGVGVAWLVVAFGTALQLRTPLPIQARVATAADVMAVVTACCGIWLATRQAVERKAKAAPA